MIGGPRRVALVAFALAWIPLASATADVSGPDIVGFVNAQRAAQGLPSGIAQDAALSDGCARHNAFGAINNMLVHAEDPSLPGYSPAGDQAARTSVVYQGGGPWTASHDPFELAPVHLHQLLAPRIDRMGASENRGYGCATTLASRNRPAPAVDVTYTYPGNGATAWPPAQVASEGPYTPGERVGIPAGTRTGPYLYVMFDGPDLTPFDTATATSATLTGPDGPVAVAIVDNQTSGLAGFLPTGMEVIPRAPLRARAAYTATVSANVSTQGGVGPVRAFGRAWAFVTGALDSDSTAPAVTITKPRHRQRINLISATTRARTRLRFAGAAKDASGVQAVFLTVERVGPRPASKRCRWLDPKQGLRRTLCTKPIIIRAKLSSSGGWRYDVAAKIKLARGAYRVIAYGLDNAGLAGNSASKAKRNVRFSLK